MQRTTRSVRRSELCRIEAGLARWSRHPLNLWVSSPRSSPCTSKRGRAYEVGSIVDMASVTGPSDCYLKIRRNSSPKVMKINRNFPVYWVRLLLLEDQFGETGNFFHSSSKIWINSKAILSVIHSADLKTMPCVYFWEKKTSQIFSKANFRNL